MGLPKKIKKDIPLIPQKQLYPRREELLSLINEKGTFLPKSVLHEDLDLGMIEFVKENLKIYSDGVEVPFIDKILSTQNWSQYTETWRFNDDDYNVIPPFVCLIRMPEMKYGSNPSTQYTIPNRKTFFYDFQPSWDGQRKGGTIYEIPQPVPIDINYSVKILTNRIRDLNKLNKNVLQKFSSRQAYTLINGQYVPIILNNITDESQMSIENRKYFMQSYEFTMLGYLIDEEEFKIKPAISRVMQMYEVDTNTYKKAPEIKTINVETYTASIENTIYEETIRYNADLIYTSSDNVSSFDVYINNQYYGTDINGIAVSTNDVLKFEIAKIASGLSTLNFKVIFNPQESIKNSPTPTPSVTVTPTSTVTPTPSMTVTPTNTITPTQSITPTLTTTPTPMSFITVTPTASITPTSSVTPSTTPNVIDAIKSQLTTSLNAYNAAPVGNWIKVTKTEYDNIAANVAGATKKGNNDAQVNNRDSLTSWQSNWIAFGLGNTPSFQINQNEYVIGMITETWNQPNGTSQLGYTTSFTGNTIINIGNAAGPSTGGVRDYFIRKAPNDPATETRYPTLFMTQSPNAVLSWNGFRSPDNGATWIALPNNQVAKIQLITTSTKSW